jgi:hypothetical protein
MTATHGGILYYVVKVPKEMRWVTVTWLPNHRAYVKYVLMQYV